MNVHEFYTTTATLLIIRRNNVFRGDSKFIKLQKRMTLLCKVSKVEMVWISNNAE